MVRKKTPEKTPLLNGNGHTDYMSANASDNQLSINNSDSSTSSIESISIDLENIDEITSVRENYSLNNLLLDSDSMSTVVSLGTDWNDWIDGVDRYGGKTTKRKDTNGNWEYDTYFPDGKIIYERLQALDIYSTDSQHITKKLFFTKQITEKNGESIFYLLYIDHETKKIKNICKQYLNENILSKELDSGLNLKTFTKVTKKLSWYDTVTTWSSNILHDSKKVLQGVGYLTAVVGTRTVQRAFTVIVSGEGEMDWDKMLKAINPTENPIEFGLTLPQLLISVLAMDAWKWGLTNVINEINKFKVRAVEDLQPNTNNTTSGINNNPSYFKSMIKILGTKLGYWVPNHLMITCSSMYTVKSLTSVSAYLDKLKSGWNILSTFIRAEVLWFISGLLKDGLAKFSETYLYTNMKNNVVSLFTKEHNLQTNNSNDEHSRVYKLLISLLKIITYSTVMIGTTVADNANKTAVVMWTADKLEEFVPTFITWEMSAIMIGLITVDTFGNKYCNVKAKQELSKLWNSLKSSCSGNNTNSQPIIAAEEEEFHDGLDNEIKLLLEQYAETEAKNINLNEEEFHDASATQPWLHANEINASEPSTSTGIYHSSLNV